jgi:hypothetical protein
MMGFEYRSPRTPLGLLSGLWALWSLYEIWTSGIGWHNGVAVTFVGGVKAVCLGCLVWAIGATTGHYSTRPASYRRLMQLFGGLGIVFLGALAVVALL